MFDASHIAPLCLFYNAVRCPSKRGNGYKYLDPILGTSLILIIITDFKEHIF